MSLANRILSEDEVAQIGFARVGRGVTIDRTAIFLNPHVIEIGDSCRIDAFALLSGGVSLKMGRNVHIATGACVYAGGGVTLGDFVGISARAVVYSVNDDYSGAAMIGPTLPGEYTNVHRAPVRIGRHVVVGAGSVVLPGVTIGEGTAIGALSLVRDDIAPFVIAAGTPARVLKERGREILQQERRFLDSLGVRRPSLEVHIPISPTKTFFTMVHCLAASMRAFAGSFGEIRLVVSVGEDCEPFDIDAARPELAPFNIEWRWTDRAAFRELSYFATGLRRWSVPFTADYVLMADADIIVVNAFSDLMDILPDDRSVAGVIANRPPFMSRDDGDDRERWPELFAEAGLGPPAFDHAIPGWGVFYGKEHASHSPPYFNYGFVFGARGAMNAIRETFESDYLIAKAFMKTGLSAQAGLCLSIVRHKLTAISLPVRYNFWVAYSNRFLKERENVRSIHYLNGPFKKHRDNGSVADIEQLVAQNRDSTDAKARFVAKHFGRVLAVMDRP